MTTRTIVALAAVGALAGCASTLDADYGSSVASLIKAQTANSATLTSPALYAGVGRRPVRALSALLPARGSTRRG